MKHQQLRVAPHESPPWVVLLPAAILLTIVWLNPVPLYGGFADDFRYLAGAQCIDCLPTNHWERRFAIVWPLGIALRLFGQNTWSVMLPPLVAGIAALLLTFKLVEWHYGRRAGLIASCVLALTPVFIDRSMRISIDVIELTFLLGAVFILQRRKGHFWAGALMALAVLCRPTQLAALPMVALLAWRQDRSRLPWFIAGFAAPILVEALVYLGATGDALYPWKLSLNHMEAWRASMDTFLYAQFISPNLDTTQSPLFNRDLIDAWQPISGIDTHWTIQGIVNLVVNSESGITLSAAIAFCLIAAKKLDRLQIALIVCAALYFGALTYAFAVDPRPRMFFPIIVIAAALIGSLTAQLWQWPRKVVVIIFALLIPATALVITLKRSGFAAEAEQANKLISEQPYLVTDNARQRLALVRQDFPSSGRDLIEIDKRCPPRMQGRWLTQRNGDLCIYTRFPWPFEPYRNGVEIMGRKTRWMLLPPNKC
jgi:hypothetical protein